MNSVLMELDQDEQIAIQKGQTKENDVTKSSNVLFDLPHQKKKLVWHFNGKDNPEATVSDFL